MSDDLILSVCIPIYNCGEFVGDALDSILSQSISGVEIIVYDGDSSDGTDLIMARYCNSYKNIRYVRAKSRGGIDADLVKCVSYARAPYCWLFSGDDVMRPGALLKALDALKNPADVYICAHTICSKAMVVSHEHPVLTPNVNFCSEFSDPKQRLEWFRRAETTEAFFSFLSGLIVRREKWLCGELPDEFKASCWGHVARFFGLISSGLKVCYVSEIWLDQRGENDSFADRGVVNRFGIGISGYHSLATHFFGSDTEEAFHIRRVIRNEFDILTFLLIKVLCSKFPERERQCDLDLLVSMTYSDRSLTNLVKKAIFFAMPYWLISCSRLVYKPIKYVRRSLKSA